MTLLSLNLDAESVSVLIGDACSVACGDVTCRDSDRLSHHLFPRREMLSMLMLSPHLPCIQSSDVTKLFKIRVRRIRISTSKIRRIQMRMRMSLNKGLFYHSEGNTRQLHRCDNMLFANVNIISIQISTI